MADETHKLQKDQPEGSREVIDHELARQAGKSGQRGSGTGPADDKDGGEPGSDGSRGRAKS